MRLHNRNATLMRRLIVAGAMVATLAGIGAAPALADDWHHRHDRFAHERFRHEPFRRHEFFRRYYVVPRSYYAPRYYYPPSYAYVPPPVVYPPPVVTPGLNFGFYLR